MATASPLDFIQAAEAYAEERHAGQTRKDGLTPYTAHTKDVAVRVQSYGVNDHITVASAHLHDVVEDTNATLDDIRSEFGDEVASLVRQLTHDPDDSKLEYLATFALKDPRACLIKLCDRISNLSDWKGMNPGYQGKYALAGKLLADSVRKNTLPHQSDAVAQGIQRALHDLDVLAGRLTTDKP